LKYYAILLYIEIPHCTYLTTGKPQIDFCSFSWNTNTHTPTHTHTDRMCIYEGLLLYFSFWLSKFIWPQIEFMNFYLKFTGIHTQKCG